MRFNYEFKKLNLLNYYINEVKDFILHCKELKILILYPGIKNLIC